ncbi:MAG: D-2-hydroxyacid dehydrogenase [Rhodospirillales bacterium]|nr:D-2-hydroxyacid dehydrogenase [Rhodospirillales bacterium]
MAKRRARTNKKRGRRSPPPKVFVYHGNHERYCKLVREHCPGVDVVGGHGPEALERHMPEADVVIAPTFPLDILPRARRLRWIQCTNAGIDFLVPARNRLKHVAVTNAGGIHGPVMADYVMAALVMLQWDFPRNFREQQARIWKAREFDPLAEKTIGIVGLGAIGRAIAERAKSAGMTVLGTKRRAGSVKAVDRVFRPNQMRNMLALSDFVVLVVPSTPETKALIGKGELAAMKRTAFLINVARGSIVDERALAMALKAKTIAGACLDVFEQEPLPAESPLWGLDNVIVTPHISGNPSRYAARVVDIFADNMKRWRTGRPFRNLVDLKRGY